LGLIAACHDRDQAAHERQDDHFAGAASLADVLADTQPFDGTVQDTGLHQVAERHHDDAQNECPWSFLGIDHQNFLQVMVVGQPLFSCCC
jgi:hypothetical protein